MSDAGTEATGGEGAIQGDGGAMMAPGVAEVLARYWGYDELRPLQGEAIQAGIDGRDSLVVMPTGGGKSLCYQVPPAVTGRRSIVVSPLISLMKDQVDGLRLCGYPAAALHSGISYAECQDIEELMLEGELSLLFVAPERLLTGRFLSLLSRMGVDSIAIDEAHCISQWGHDFRPEYRRLAELRERFPDAAMHAFTATATARVREDIVGQLQLRDPAVLVGRFDRPNLKYRVLPRVKLVDQVVEVLAGVGGEAAIIYCISRKDTEQLAASLCDRGVEAKAYHAGLETRERRKVQEAFAKERVNVITATVAFGMGIDRSNVRCVMHTAMPKTVEHYQQETGRAGRDGLDADCVLFYSGSDAKRWRDLIELSAADSPDPEAVIGPQMELMHHMQQFCRSMKCRHKQLSAYFGQDLEGENCGACDVCLKEVEEVADGLVTAQKILSCVARVRQTFGAAHVVDVLRGSGRRGIRERGHDQLSTYGLLSSVRRETVMSYIDQLVDQGVLMRSGGEYPVLSLTDRSKGVLRGEVEVKLFAARGAASPVRSGGRGGANLPPLTGEDAAIFGRLRGLRAQQAHLRGVPPYLVFGDATLREMALIRPTTVASMLRVHGVGQKKLDEFGEVFMETIRDHCATRGWATDLTSAEVAG